MGDNQWGPGNLAKTGKPIQDIMIGTEKADLFFGEHPHSRSDDKIYARMPDGEVHSFSGHRILWGVQIQEFNYLKESGVSGDNVRPGCTILIFANGEQVFEDDHRNIEAAMRKAAQIIAELEDCSIHIWDKEERAKLKGRKIYWRDHPAVIQSLILDQGCVIIAPDGMPRFPQPAYRLEDSEDWDDEGDETVTVKTSILDKNIWWWRK